MNSPSKFKYVYNHNLFFLFHALISMHFTKQCLTKQIYRIRPVARQVVQRVSVYTLHVSGPGSSLAAHGPQCAVLGTNPQAMCQE